MALSRKITLQSVTTDGKGIIIKDTTGVYDVSINPGGYGTPNPERTDFVVASIKVAYLDGSLSWLYTSDATALLSGDAFTITSNLLIPVPGDYPFKDGVLLLTTYAGLESVTITGNAGDTMITGDDLSTFEGADSVIDDSGTTYIIDQSYDNNYDTGPIHLTTPITTEMDEASPGYAASCYVMVYAEMVCKLTAAVGSMAQQCNEDGWSAALGDLLVKKFAADFDFGSADYWAAQNNISTSLNKLNSLLNG